MAAATAAQTVRDVLGGYTAVPEEVREYAADTAAGLLDDMQVRRGSADTRRGGAPGRSPPRGSPPAARASVAACAPRVGSRRGRLR
jgi:hypothetical protein